MTTISNFYNSIDQLIPATPGFFLHGAEEKRLPQKEVFLDDCAAHVRNVKTFFTANPSP